MSQTQNNAGNPFREYRTLHKAGQLERAVECLQRALQRRSLTAPEVIRAGRLILKHLKGSEQGSAPLQVLILGQFTTSFLVPALAAAALGNGTPAFVQEGDYDNVMQHLLALEESPDVLVLAPWNHRLFAAERSADERVQDEVNFWRQAWDSVAGHTRLLQIGYDWIHPGASGHHLGGRGAGHINLVRRTNQTLRENLPPGAFFVDLEQVSGEMGRRRFYDSRNYHWAKQPFSEEGTVRLAEHVWSGIRAMLTGPKKVLALDLDDTLWGGVVGEVGSLGLDLGESPSGEAFLAFQRHLKEMSRQGCLLAICSKNNFEDAQEPFLTNPHMELSLDDFAAFEASWDPKHESLQRIARTLRLSLQDFVFFDDNPAERELIRQALPEVEVVEVPQDPSDYIWALQEGLWFESSRITEEDRLRTGQYRSESRRRLSRSRFATIESYLESLEMVAEVSSIKDTDLDRVMQLIGKTNQFNLTTRRQSLDFVRGAIDDGKSISLAMRMADRFGPLGLVSVILACPEPSQRCRTLRIDTWLMSCRVIGRSAELFLFAKLVEKARQLDYQWLLGEYIPSKKNAQVEDLYPRLGFRRRSQARNSTFYELELSLARPPDSFVKEGAAGR